MQIKQANQKDKDNIEKNLLTNEN